MEAQILASIFFGMGIGVLLADYVFTKTFYSVKSYNVNSCCNPSGTKEEEAVIEKEETVLTE